MIGECSYLCKPEIITSVTELNLAHGVAGKPWWNSNLSHLNYIGSAGNGQYNQDATYEYDFKEGVLLLIGTHPLKGGWISTVAIYNNEIRNITNYNGKDCVTKHTDTVLMLNAANCGFYTNCSVFSVEM